jgi:hypothetical protein
MHWFLASTRSLATCNLIIETLIFPKDALPCHSANNNFLWNNKFEIAWKQFDDYSYNKRRTYILLFYEKTNEILDKIGSSKNLRYSQLLISALRKQWIRRWFLRNHLFTNIRIWDFWIIIISVCAVYTMSVHTINLVCYEVRTD